MNSNTATHIDATGLICPMPLMLLKKAMQDLHEGAQVRIDVTDVHAELDFEIWCERFGHSLEKCQEPIDTISFIVTKGHLSE